MDKMKGFIKIAFPVILVIVLGLISIVACGVFVEYQSCNEFASINSDREFRFDFWTGCKMKTPDGFWISTRLLTVEEK